MKKILAGVATLLLAFGGVALSTNVAIADDVPPAEVVTETAVTDDTTTTAEEIPATEEQPSPPGEQPPSGQVAEVTKTEIAAEPEESSGTDPPVEVASRFAAESVETLDVDYGIIGTLQAFSDENNKPESWTNAGPHDGAICYKYEDGKPGFSDNDHAYVINDGKTVILKPFGATWPGDHWELLVVKASTMDAVTIHPTAGTWYAAFEYKEISHYIVCKGDTPDEDPKVASASVMTTPGTCEAEGGVVGVDPVNATFGDPTYEDGKYTIVATATGDALFAAGAGVSDDRTTKTFKGDLEPQNTELCTGEVTFCHAHPADTAANGWELMSNKPVQSVNGHKEHEADIIPPVPGILPLGLNWNASFEVNGATLSAQEILRLGCNFDIEVPKAPSPSNEYCFDGETQEGSITVYFGDLDDKIQYRITGGAGVNILIEDGDDTTVYLPAGDYTVTAEAVPPYQIKGQDEWEFTIGSAINCVCKADSVNEIAAFSVVENPVCAEAEVSVKPATCEAAAGLVLGETLHASFGEPVIENGTYSVVATADDGFRFFPGEGVSEDGSTKTFEGTLAPKKTVCGDLTTLSLPNTGGQIADGALWLGVFAIGFGVIGVIVATRRAAAKQ
jgi:hypothetical protein